LFNVLVDHSIFGALPNLNIEQSGILYGVAGYLYVLILLVDKLKSKICDEKRLKGHIFVFHKGIKNIVTEWYKNDCQNNPVIV
jgi:hypothetical protein